jgi:aminoglycoside 6'-N-acetyltransferase
LNPKIDPIERSPAPGLVTLRPATPADAALLRRWDRAPHVIAAKGNDDWQWETELAIERDWREQFIAEVAGHPVGFLQIMDPEREGQYWGCIESGHRAIDIWIGERDYLNRGYGTQMMELAIERAFADPTVHTILIDPLESNDAAHRFYERLGFEYVVNRCFGDDRCCVYRLSRPDDTRGHA